MGSQEMMLAPRRVASALKLAGPSPQPRILRPRSASVRANIRRYSSNDRPQGTTCSNVNMDSGRIRRGRGGNIDGHEDLPRSVVEDEPIDERTAIVDGLPVDAHLGMLNSGHQRARLRDVDFE